MRRGIVLCVSLLAMLALCSPASATHNRATQLSWTAGTGPGEVHFSIDFVARAGYYGSPQVGESIYDPVLEFGDGQSTTPALVVTEVEGDVVYTHGSATHTYATNGPHTATVGSCCRLSSSSGHVNNGDLSYKVHTLVDLGKGTSSPSIAVAPIVYCPTAGSCSFALAGSGAGPGNHLRWRLATPSETGEASFVQPGPPHAPNALTIDPVQGRVTWNTTGATLSSSGLPTYYSTQVVAEEVNSAGETVSEAVADFFIALDDDHTQQPHCHSNDADGQPDDDADGLCDNWETDGIDADGDHQADISLPGADPDRQDIYVEIDYMEGREPQLGALQDVAKAFAAHDIAVHFFVDEEIPFASKLGFGPLGCAPSCPAGTVDFDEVKENYFGASGDRASVNSKQRLEALRYAYHYVLYANDQPGESTGSSGIAELPGNDLAITLGNPSWLTSNGTGPPTRRNEAGTLMHELGHNLGLFHGGGDVVNCKPNYLSVMNYTRQVSGFITAQLDYSDAVLAPLDETDLDESLGIQGPGGAQVVHGPGAHWVSDSTGAIDWNRKDGIQNGVGANVNFIADKPGCKKSPPGETLVGWDDWANLSLAFQATADFADGVHSTLFTQEPEIAAADFAGIDDDGDGLLNLEDECPTQAGPASNGGCPVASGPVASGPGTPPAAAQPLVGQPAPIRVAPNTRLRRARFGADKRTAKFRFGGSQAGLSFQCKLDRGKFKPCRSPRVYRGLAPGRHVFRVRAVDAAGLVDASPALRRFKTLE